MYRKRNDRMKIIALYAGDYKREYYLREISKTAKIPLQTTQRQLAELDRDKILKTSISGKNKYFALNLDNPNTKLALLQSELCKTEQFLDRYTTFKTFVRAIKSNSLIVIFGSFAKFSADKNSDLDLLIVPKEKEKLPYHLLGYKIHEIELSESSFVKSVQNRETIIKEIEGNHIILNNHSFYVNVMWTNYGTK